MPKGSAAGSGQLPRISSSKRSRLKGKQTSGPFLICRLTKKNWELQHAVKEIAKRLGISHRRIGWAGTKDRNAVTTQWISLYNVTPEQVAAVHLKDITLEPLARSNEGLSLGDLQGNRFDIVIRDPDPADLDGPGTAAFRKRLRPVCPIISGSSGSGPSAR